jgi:hypothetical protein
MKVWKGSAVPESSPTETLVLLRYDSISSSSMMGSSPTAETTAGSSSVEPSAVARGG